MSITAPPAAGVLATMPMITKDAIMTMAMTATITLKAAMGLLTLTDMGTRIRTVWAPTR